MYACKTPRAVYAGSGALNQLPALLGGAKEVAVFSDRGVEQSGVLALPLKLLEDAGIAIQGDSSPVREEDRQEEKQW